MRTDDFQFILPEELIAKNPLASRDASRLLVLPRKEGSPAHRMFAELPLLLRPGDLIVANDTRVIPARIIGRKAETGGRVEVLLVSSGPTRDWSVMVGSSKPIRRGMRLVFPSCRGDFGATVLETQSGGYARLSFDVESAEFLERLFLGDGEMPLPSYIERGRSTVDVDDRDRYQTIFARNAGAVAAPTAGLHFTERTLADLAAAGISMSFVTLHVGPGTFLPVRTDDLDDHEMHAESYDVPTETAEAVVRARGSGGRVLAVGTTTLRALEAAAIDDGLVRPGRGETNLFIRPGYRLRAVDGLLTNFHLPRSTLLMLVCAIAGRERVLDAYREAVERRYRFYSYGDAMLLL